MFGSTQARSFAVRLLELLRREQGSMAEFLIALADFDRQRLWQRLGHTSLFSFLLRHLGLSRSAAFYRHTAAQLVQRFPEVIPPLRDGRLCLTAIVELARVMTPENRAQVLPRFFSLSKREAREVAAEIAPHEAPPRREVVTTVRPEEPTLRKIVHVEPLTAELRRLHITVSKRFLDKLDAARAALSHSRPHATTEDLLEAGLDLLLAQDAKRKGQVSRPQQKVRPSAPGHFPARVKREIWQRDGGRCQWRLESGQICGSNVRVQIDHVQPRALGGASTAENGRLLCAAHNLMAARHFFGDSHIDKYGPS